MINLNHFKSKLPTPPTRVIRSINTVRSMMSRVHRNLAPSSIALLEVITGMWMAQALSVAAALNLADEMGDAETDSDALAKKVGAKPEPLYRLMRALTNIGVFEERPNRRFKLTAIGQCLKADAPHSVKAMASFQGQFHWQNWGHLMHSVKTGDTAIEHVHEGKCLSEVMKEQPEVQQQFDIFMCNISSMEINAIMAAYSFANSRVVADIGGGHGSLLYAVLAGNPQARGILFDQPQVLVGALKELKKMGGRCQFAAGDFFTDVPEGADTYLMKHIIHDWDGKDCGKILAHVRKAIPSNGKLILLETVIPAPNVHHFSKLLDLEMLVAAGGMERTADEYRDLLNRSGFHVTRIVPTASLVSVIEAVPD